MEERQRGRQRTKLVNEAGGFLVLRQPGGPLPCVWLAASGNGLHQAEAHFLSERWDEVIADEEPKRCLDEVLLEVKKNDPVRGIWRSRGDKARIWVDASSLALGAVMEIDGSIVEDASWLRKEDATSTWQSWMPL